MGGEKKCQEEVANLMLLKFKGFFWGHSPPNDFLIFCASCVKFAFKKIGVLNFTGMIAPG